MLKKYRIDLTRRTGVLIGVVFIALIGIAPVAQSGSMGNGAAQRNAAAQTQATKDQAVATQCLAQPGTMNSQACKDAKARHPEMFKSGAKPNTAMPR